MNRDQAKALLPIIQAFAEGAEIQMKPVQDDRWTDVANPAWNVGMEYRVKPEPEKCEPYRRFLYRNQVTGKAEAAMVWSLSGANSAIRQDSFICWIDAEWQTAEVPNQED